MYAVYNLSRRPKIPAVGLSDSLKSTSMRIYGNVVQNFRGSSMAERYTHAPLNRLTWDEIRTQLINCHPGVSPNVCAVPRMDLKQASHLPAFIGGH